MHIRCTLLVGVFLLVFSSLAAAQQLTPDSLDSPSSYRFDRSDLQQGRIQRPGDVLERTPLTRGVEVWYNDLSIRSQELSGLSYLVDGVDQRDLLSNRPFPGGSLNAFETLTIRTGGISARHGGFQGGLIEATTRPGTRQYTGSIDARYSRPGLKHFGPMMYGFDSPMVKPFLMPAEGEPDLYGARTGFLTDENGTPLLDRFGNRLRNRYFNGWENSAAYKPHQNKPYDYYALWLWQHRSPEAIEELQRLDQEGLADIEWAEGFNPEEENGDAYGLIPDYDVSGSLAGPVPFLDALRPTTFSVSFDRNQTEYSVGTPDPRYRYGDVRGSIESALSPGTTIRLQGTWSNQRGFGVPGGSSILPWIADNPFSGLSEPTYWYPDYTSTGDVKRQSYRLSLEQKLSEATRLELAYTHQRYGYGIADNLRETIPNDLGLPESRRYIGVGGLIGTEAYADSMARANAAGWKNWRDWARIRIGGQWYDELPEGHAYGQLRDVTGFSRMSGGRYNRSDTWTRSHNVAGQLSTRLGEILDLEAGASARNQSLFQEFWSLDPPFRGGDVYWLDASEWLGDAYAEGSFSWRGLQARAGLRLDWLKQDAFPALDGAPTDTVSGPFAGRLLRPGGIGTLSGRPGDALSLNVYDEMPLRSIGQMGLSPRLALSYTYKPFGTLFAHYDRFLQWADPNERYRLDLSVTYQRPTAWGNPHLDPLTMRQFEFGYRSARMFRTLAVAATYFVQRQSGRTHSLRYVPIGYSSLQSYTSFGKLNASGYELRLAIDREDFPWLGGWVSLNQMRQELIESGVVTLYQEPGLKPLVLDTHSRANDFQPTLRTGLAVRSPEHTGAGSLADLFLGSWQADLLYQWRRGERITWNPDAMPGIENNLRWRAYSRADLRLSKQIYRLGRVRSTLYVDVSNLLNTKNMTRRNGNDVSVSSEMVWDNHYDPVLYVDYMRSLDMVVSEDGSVSGSDRPGDFPKHWPDYTYTPIERYRDLEQMTEREPKDRYGKIVYDPQMIYHTRDDGRYFQMQKGTDGQWTAVDVDPERIKEILEERSYIDMPFFTPLTFLEKRDVYFGLRIDF